MRILIFILSLIPGVVNCQAIISASPAYAPRLVASSNDGFSRSISFDPDTAPHSLTDYPVLITGTFAYLKSEANGGKVKDAQGDDITFSTSAYSSGLLNYQLVSWNAATGFIEAWVKIPSFSSSTVFYLNYGSATITTFQGNVSGTWDSNFLGVYHGNDIITANAQQLTDATGNAAHYQSRVSFGSWGQANPVTGKIGSGQEINPTGSGWDNSYRRSTNFALTGAYTIEAWVKVAGTGTGYIVFGDTAAATWTHFFGAQYRMDIAASTKITSANTTTTGTWYHLAITRSGTTFLIYENGVQTGTSANGANINVNAFGARSGDAGSSNITYDEIRVSSTNRSANWLITSFNNQNDPATFFAVGSEI